MDGLYHKNSCWLNQLVSNVMCVYNKFKLYELTLYYNITKNDL